MVGNTALLQFSFFFSFVSVVQKGSAGSVSYTASIFLSYQIEERKEKNQYIFPCPDWAFLITFSRAGERLNQFLVSAVTTTAAREVVTGSLITPIYRIISLYFSSFFTLPHKLQFKLLSRIRGLLPSTRKSANVSKR